MTSYSHDRNSVEEIPFELAKSLPPVPIPLHEILTPDLQRVVSRQPNATLEQLCHMVQVEQGVMLSSTSMCRVLKRVGLTSKERHQLTA